MKIAVIDDEQRYMDILARVCNGYFTIRSEQGSVDCFLNGQDFLNKCSENLYDAAFIDIYMSPINGIELAEELRKISKDILIVFVTTSSDFMMQAFYIKDKAKFIRIVCDRKSVMISVKEIMSIESDAHYLNISVVSGMTYRTRMTMNEFLKLTDNDERFIPVNRGVVLNADYIERIDGALCIMGNGTRFSIKVREKSIIEKRVRDHMFKKLRENQRI